MDTHWYAVYTRPRWEKKVAETLTMNSIENYCPLNKVVRQWSDRKKIVEEPLFTSYVFVKVNAKEHAKLRQTDGVVNLVYWLGKPAVIRDSEIELIRQFLREYQNVKLERTRIHIEDVVKVNEGPFSQMEGKVIAVKSSTVKIILPSLRCFLTAEIDKSSLTVVTPRTDSRSLSV